MDFYLCTKDNDINKCDNCLDDPESCEFRLSFEKYVENYLESDTKDLTNNTDTNKTETVNKQEQEFLKDFSNFLESLFPGKSDKSSIDRLLNILTIPKSNYRFIPFYDLRDKQFMFINVEDIQTVCFTENQSDDGTNYLNVKVTLKDNNSIRVHTDDDTFVYLLKESKLK